MNRLFMLFELTLVLAIKKYQKICEDEIKHQLNMVNGIFEETPHIKKHERAALKLKKDLLLTKMKNLKEDIYLLIDKYIPLYYQSYKKMFTTNFIYLALLIKKGKEAKFKSIDKKLVESTEMEYISMKKKFSLDFKKFDAKIESNTHEAVNRLKANIEERVERYNNYINTNDRLIKFHYNKEYRILYVYFQNLQFLVKEIYIKYVNAVLITKKEKSNDLNLSRKQIRFRDWKKDRKLTIKDIQAKQKEFKNDFCDEVVYRD